jgi:hypothetical protein
MIYKRKRKNKTKILFTNNIFLHYFAKITQELERKMKPR